MILRFLSRRPSSRRFWLMAQYWIEWHSFATDGQVAVSFDLNSGAINVFALQCGDGLNSVGAANRLSARLRETEALLGLLR